MRPGLMLAAALLLASAPRAEDPAKKVLGVPIVVVDPGHGGVDVGARGGDGVLEKDLTLAVSKRLAAELRKRGVEVVLTRDRDVFLPLTERTALANRARAWFFVSVHANSAPDTEVSGPETYFLSVDASDDEAMRVAMTENDVFGQAGTAADSRDVVGQVLGDLIRTEYLRESSDLAGSVQHELHKLPVERRGVKQAPFVVLTGANMPAVLVEIGFVTHKAEAKALGQRERQSAIARAVAEAVVAAIRQNRGAAASEAEGDAR